MTKHWKRYDTPIKFAVPLNLSLTRRAKAKLDGAKITQRKHMQQLPRAKRPPRSARRPNNKPLRNTSTSRRKG
jgi:hypothetical protein